MKIRGVTQQELQDLILSSKQSREVTTFRRLTVIIAAFQGQSISELSRIFRVSRSTIHNWLRRYQKGRTAESLVRWSGSGRIAKWEDVQERVVVEALDSYPVEWGYSSYAWTSSIIGRHLWIMTGVKFSPHTIRRKLKELGYSWKRPRYLLLPDPSAEKKTLNSS